MYIIAECVYPSEIAKEVAKAYLNAVTKYPDDASVGTPIVQGAVHGTLQGISVMTIIEPKKGKLEEAYTLAVNRMVMLQEIKGFKYSFRLSYTLEEAMKTIGM